MPYPYPCVSPQGAEVQEDLEAEAEELVEDLLEVKGQLEGLESQEAAALELLRGLGDAHQVNPSPRTL